MWRRSARDRVVIVGLAVATIVILTLDFRTGVVDGVAGAVGQVVAVFQSGVRTVARPVQGAFEAAQQFGRQRERIAELEDENADFRLKLEQLTDSVREGRILEELERIEQGLDEQTVTAFVVAASLTGLDRTVVIDKGSRDGVVADTAVLAPEGVIGRVVDVGPRSARVLLVTDPKSSVGVRIGETGDTGVVTGTRSDLLDLGLVDQAVIEEGAVRPGDTILTSGREGGIFPRGIPVGSVETVRKRSRASSEYEIKVKPFARMSRLDAVVVVLRSEARLVPPPEPSDGDS